MSKPTSPALQSGNPLATGLVRCIALTEGSGSNLADYSVNAANLTTRTSFATASGSWHTDPDQGSYLSFDGSTQDAFGPDTNLPIGNSARTFAFLVRSSSRTAAFFAGYGTTGDSALGFALGTPNSNTQSAQGFLATTLTHASASAVDEADGTWHLGHLVLDGSNNLTVFVDGVRVPVGNDGASTATSIVFSPVSTALSGRFYLGQIGTTAGSNPDQSYGTNGNGLIYTGDMAGVWAWNRALSPADINNHYSDPWQMVRPSAVVNPTSITLTGPSSGTTGQGSASFTATLDHAAPTGGTAISLASSVSGDTFAPTSLTIAAGATSATFTLTTTVDGQRTITATSSGLTSGTITYASATAGSSSPPSGTKVYPQVFNLKATGLSVPGSILQSRPVRLHAERCSDRD